MAKKSKTKEQPKVKVQIPVSRELADELARWAKALELTQGRLCETLLQFAIDDPKLVSEWLADRVYGKCSKRQKAGWLQMGDNSAVRLQVLLEERLAERIETSANRLNQSGVRYAALLLDFALADEQFAMGVLSSWLGKGLFKLFGKKPEEYESAEVQDD